jgi:hypothetical protein
MVQMHLHCHGSNDSEQPTLHYHSEAKSLGRAFAVHYPYCDVIVEALYSAVDPHIHAVYMENRLFEIEKLVVKSRLLRSLVIAHVEELLEIVCGHGFHQLSCWFRIEQHRTQVRVSCHGFVTLMNLILMPRVDGRGPVRRHAELPSGWFRDELRGKVWQWWIMHGTMKTKTSSSIIL